MPLRHVPRFHAGLVTSPDSSTQHAAAPDVQGTALCGVTGDIVRNRFEDVGRSRSCPACQARSDAIQAADLLGALRGAIQRGEFPATNSLKSSMNEVETAFLATYPADPSEPDFDVQHRA